MWVAELLCAKGHGFEGWFGSREDFDSQRQRGLVSCPQCGSGQVERKLSAPRLNLGATEVSPVAPTPTGLELAKFFAALRANSEDLGAGFAKEARRMHEGEVPERAIRGQATRDELVALVEDGIPVLPMPSPEALQKPH